MNAHVAYMVHNLQSQVAGPQYIEHHFGWWSIACLVLTLVLMKCAEVIRSHLGPSTGNGIKKFSQQLVGIFPRALVGILYLSAILSGIAWLCLVMMWIIAQRHHPGNM